MHLLEIETRNWCGLSQTVGVFSPRLNAIFGSNEAGKSRLFQALRYAMFESYKGASQHKQALQSWTSPEAPFVRLSLEIGGVQYEIRKQFLKGGYAELSGAGVTLRNEEAEQRLRQLLGARAGGNREIGQEDMGIWPLLMIRQGAQAQSASDALNDDSRSQLQGRLAAEIGAAAISEQGARLIELSQQQHDRYFTSTGLENVTLKNARSRVEAATELLAKETSAYGKQIETAGKLSDARKDLEDVLARLKMAREEHTTAAGRAEAAQSAQAKVREATSAVALAEAKFKAAEDESNAIEELAQAQSRVQEQGRLVEQDIARRVSEQSSLDSQIDAARIKLATAEEVQREARRREDLARKAQLAQTLNEQIAQLSKLIERLKINAGKIEEARQHRSRLIEVSDPDLEALRNLDQAHRNAAAQLEAAAIRISITTHQACQVDGHLTAPGKPLSIEIVDTRTITIGDLAEIEVRPSVGSLDELRQAKLDASEAFGRKLESLQQESLASAAAANLAWKSVHQDLATLTREAQALSSRSLDDLEYDLSDAQARLGLLGNLAGAEDLAKVMEAVGQAEDEVNQARNAKASLELQLSELREGLSAQKGVQKGLADQYRDITDALTKRGSPAAVAAQLQAAREDRSNAYLKAEAAERAFESLGGESAKADADRLQRAVDALSTRQGELRSSVDTLAGSLSTLMSGGSYEKVADAEAQLDEATVILNRLLRQANAAKRLHGVLMEHRRKAVDQMTAPVITRIKPYLAEIFPGSRLLTGQNLEFQGLQTQNMQEEFGSLSKGAQEQLALMTRIGVAEVLAGGSRLPLILDDSLVNSDPERIRQIHRVLDRAANHLQIILLSCHEPLFDALGADYQVRLPRTRR